MFIHLIEKRMLRIVRMLFLKLLCLISIYMSLYFPCLIAETLPEKPTLEFQMTSEKRQFLNVKGNQIHIHIC